MMAKSKPTVAESGNVLIYPVGTEKAISQLEFQGKITFIESKSSTKPIVKAAFEEMYGAKVERVNMMNAIDGRKKAYITLKPGFNVDELAGKLGII